MIRAARESSWERMRRSQKVHWTTIPRYRLDHLSTQHIWIVPHISQGNREKVFPLALRHEQINQCLDLIVFSYTITKLNSPKMEFINRYCMSFM